MAAAKKVEVCCVCHATVPSRNRRTLNPEGGESNRRVISFLVTYMDSIKPGPTCYICRPCFAEAERGSKAVESGVNTINSFRAKLNLQPASAIIQLPTPQESDDELATPKHDFSHAPQSSQSPSPSRKRKRVQASFIRDIKGVTTITMGETNLAHARLV